MSSNKYLFINLSNKLFGSSHISIFSFSLNVFINIFIGLKYFNNNKSEFIFKIFFKYFNFSSFENSVINNIFSNKWIIKFPFDFSKVSVLKIYFSIVENIIYFMENFLLNIDKVTKCYKKYFLNSVVVY